MLSQTTEYAVRAILHIATRGDGATVRANELAAQIGVPQNYLSKTLHQLARAGLLTSARGPTGGFQLAIPAESLTLQRIVSTFEPPTPRRWRGHGQHEPRTASVSLSRARRGDDRADAGSAPRARRRSETQLALGTRKTADAARVSRAR